MKTLVDKITDPNISFDKRIFSLGQLIDQSTDNSSKSNLIKSISLGELLLSEIDNDLQKSTTNYFIANAYSGLRQVAFQMDVDETMPWEDKNLEKELIHLRCAFNASSGKLSKEQKTDFLFRIETNLGNALNHIGRFSEALEFWDSAISKHSDFAMASGNRGYGLYFYSSILYDPGHQSILLDEARKSISRALKNRLEGSARESFLKILRNINQILKSEDEIQIKDFSLGRSNVEKFYRSWALSNRLFLNPLNDLETPTIAANDILTLPPIVTKLREPPQLYGLFNQIKQEYASARYLLFEGIIKDKDSPHFSDKKVLLYNTLDYPVYGLSIEKVKTAFLVSYSLLDKIAFLLNNYLKLGIPEQRITFRTFWYGANLKKKKLRNQFVSSNNWPLRGLFWLSKDFYEKDEGFIESIEPNAKELNTIRNHIAHKYLKVHDHICWTEDQAGLDLFHDKLCYSIGRENLEKKTLKLLKLIRNAIIYCVFGVHFNETHNKKIDKSKIVPSYLDVIDDSWKV